MGPFNVQNVPFACGSNACAYSAYQYVTDTPGSPIYGMGFSFGVSGSGGSGWVQTYTSSDNLAYGNGNGNNGFVADAGNTANPWYSRAYSNGNNFADSPGVPALPGFFLAQTSLVQPNGNGGYSPALTVMWGMSYSASGQFSILGPVIATPWAAQQQNIGNVH